MISFIVPAHNEEPLLGAALDSIHESAASIGEPFEVIVADDASTDATAEIALAHGARVISVGHRQIAATRNSGASLAGGDWLVFVDGDTIINAEVLRAAFAALRGGAVGGGAMVTFEGKAPPVVRLVGRVFMPFYFWLRLAAGCFVFCSREAFDRVGGFDEKLYASEEVVFSRELKKLGRFVVLRERVVTSGRKLRTHTLGEMLRPLGGLLLRGRKAFERREGLDLWYGERREDTAAEDTPA